MSPDANWVAETCKAVMTSTTASVDDKNACHRAMVNLSNEFSALSWPAAVVLAAMFLALGAGLYALNRYN